MKLADIKKSIDTLESIRVDDLRVISSDADTVMCAMSVGPVPMNTTNQTFFGMPVIINPYIPKGDIVLARYVDGELKAVKVIHTAEPECTPNA